MNPIPLIAIHNIPIKSYVAATQFLSANRLTGNEYRDRVKELTGHDSPMFDDEHVRIHYMYLVQESIRHSKTTPGIQIEDIYELATERAKKFIANNPWAFSKPEDENVPKKLDAAGNPKKPKGAKKEMAIELFAKMVQENKGNFPARKDAIERFVKEIGMTPAGASTYVANCKANYGKGSW